jgi:hypothetical protein
MAIEKTKALKGIAFLGSGSFLALYAASIIIASRAGILITDYASVLISRDAFLLEGFLDSIGSPDAAAPFRLILSLELLIGLSFGLGFSALFSSWALRARGKPLVSVSHRVLAHLAGLSGGLDAVGTVLILAALSGPRPIPAFYATIAGMAYIARLPLSYIIILWCLGGLIAALLRRMSKAKNAIHPANPAEKPVP